jgi:colanic acid biosynthesis protein WcaH
MITFDKLKLIFTKFLLYLLRLVLPRKKSELGTIGFHLVSALTPMINVDLLVRNPSNKAEVLLIWRHDHFYQGWHLPGGVIRFKESAIDRAKIVARNEFLAEIITVCGPLQILEITNNSRDIRGHFISLLYEILEFQFLDTKKFCTEIERPKPGEWAWFSKAPNNLLHQHDGFIGTIWAS